MSSIQDAQDRLAWSQAMQILTRLTRELQQLNINLDKVSQKLDFIITKIPEEQAQDNS